jgi:hypothetical protein
MAIFFIVQEEIAILFKFLQMQELLLEFVSLTFFGMEEATLQLISKLSGGVLFGISPS